MSPLTVLVVDDDADMRLYVRSCVRGLGSMVERVVEAADGLEALPLLRSGAVDIVISDVFLPRFDGYALCDAIKADPTLQHIPVLLISGEDAVPPAIVGADGFLSKPFNALQLQTALQELLLRPPRASPEVPPAPSPG